jgi:hypothetical protein
MGTSENENGQGRFGRIEDSLLRLEKGMTDFRVEVERRFTVLETTAGLEQRTRSETVSSTAYKWMKAGVASSVLIGVVTFVLRILHV